jgi:hypothetical protein
MRDEILAFDHTRDIPHPGYLETIRECSPEVSYEPPKATFVASKPDGGKGGCDRKSHRILVSCTGG